MTGPTQKASRALHVTVVNGDLSFVAEPILVGHYTASRLTGTEALLDGRLGGTMQRALQLGMYPDEAARSSQVFVNPLWYDKDPLTDPRPRAVVVVGLGEEGSLTGTALARSVRHGVLAWAQRLASEPPVDRGEMVLAATLLGSGGLGVRVGQVAQLIVQGVLDANESLRATGLPNVVHLQLIELYLDRATEAWRALAIQSRAGNGEVALHDEVVEGRGPLKRPLDAGYRGADYDVVSATIEDEADGRSTIAYTLSTRRARSEVRGKSAQVALVRQMVERASNRFADVGDIGRPLWDLVIPRELEPLLVEASDSLLLELTPATAGIPWEMLDSRRAPTTDDVPWAVRTKLVRRLRTGTFRERPDDARDTAAVLVIGDPLTSEQDKYPSLAAARHEAADVAQLFEPNGPEDADDGLPSVARLYDERDRDNAGVNGDRVIKTLLARSWRIVHICAHGAEPMVLEAAGQAGVPRGARGVSRGVVLSDDMFLGPDEIRSLRVVPELVFLNCCHLARGSTDDVIAQTPYDRPAFAASLAEALIEVGVRCVVAAGWAVEEEASREFARVFYGALRDGMRFMDAAAKARLATYANERERKTGGSTWAAFQCYGDPEWSLRWRSGDAQRPAPPPALDDEFAGIASPSGLRLTLHTLATQSEYQGADRRVQARKLRYLARKFGKRWNQTGVVAESFGHAWGEAGELADAVMWYETARTAPDGTASLRATEQLANLLARQAWEAIAPVLRTVGRVKIAASETSAARRKLATATALLEWVSSLPTIDERDGGNGRDGRTAERENLLGSVQKRLAMLELALGRRAEADAALQRMVAHYGAAAERCAVERHGSLHYPVMNQLAGAIALHAGRADWRGLDATLVQVARDDLTRWHATDPNFWSGAGRIELDMYLAIASRDLASRLDGLQLAYTDIHERVPSVLEWKSVYDQGWLVLESYARRTAGAERNAARTLLGHLRRNTR